MASALIGRLAVAIENLRRMAGKRLVEPVPCLAIVVYPRGGVRVVHDQVPAFSSLVQTPVLTDSTSDGDSVIHRTRRRHAAALVLASLPHTRRRRKYALRTSTSVTIT